MRGRYGENNQAGDLSPRTGPYSDGIRRQLGALFVDPVPVVPAHAYNGWLGGNVVGFVESAPVVTPGGYGGVVPASLQPTLRRSPPWGS